MKHTGLKIVLALILLLGLVCAAALAQALTLGELPKAAELNANAVAPSFEVVGIGGTTISSAELDGKVTILLYGRTTCYNCNRFMSGMKDAIPLLQENGVGFLAILYDAPTDEEMQAFSDQYGSCRIAKNGISSNGMWEGLDAVGFKSSGSVTFPIIFIRDQNSRLRYYSIGPYSGGNSQIRSVAAAALELAGVEIKRPTVINLNVSSSYIGQGENVIASYTVTNPDPNGRIVYRVEVTGSNEMYYTDVEYAETGSLPTEGTIQYTLTNPYAQTIDIYVEQLVDGKITGQAKASIGNRNPTKMNLQFTVANPNAQYAPGATCRFDSEVSGTAGLGTAEVEWKTEMINYNGKEEDESAWTVRFVSDGKLTDVTDGSQWFEVKIPTNAKNDEVVRTTFTFTCGGWTKTVVKKSVIAGATPDVIDVEKIAGFVNRCYSVILGRGADPEGLAAWVKALATGEAKASEIIDGFVNSQEFLNKGLTKEQQVKVLYQAMLGREPDPAGLAAWTDVLNQGYPFGSVINGFCGSKEFINLCNEYGIQPGSVNVGPVTPAGENKIKAFVRRCYQIILGRDADADGLEAWAKALETGTRKASEIIDGFVNSLEFLNKNLTKGEQVDVLYQAMLGRAADPMGKEAWVQVLNDGYPFAAVINGFCGSTEFINLCAEYGIQPGSVQVKSAFVKRVSITPEGSDAEDSAAYIAYSSEYINEEKIRAFVKHCYETVLSREGDEEGIANYTALVMDGKKTPKRVAYEFVFSPEFQNQLPGNEELIRILYRLYLNREPGAEELAGWIEMLDGGAGLDEVLKGFAESAEFRAIMREMKE